MTNKELKFLLELRKKISEGYKNRNIKSQLGTTFYQLERDIKSAVSFWENNQNTMKMLGAEYERLQIGGGSRYLKNFVNIDVFPPADVIWDCRYKLPFKNESFKFVFSEHFLEHIDFPSSVKFVLNDVRRVLKPGGTLFLSIPDGGRAISAYTRNSKPFLRKLYKVCYSGRKPKVEIFGKIDIINYLFRDQIENKKYTPHYWAYDVESITNLLKSIGFKKVKRAGFDKNYCNPKRKFYTLYIKAIK